MSEEDEKKEGSLVPSIDPALMRRMAPEIVEEVRRLRATIPVVMEKIDSLKNLESRAESFDDQRTLMSMLHSQQDRLDGHLARLSEISRSAQKRAKLESFTGFWALLTFLLVTVALVTQSTAAIGVATPTVAGLIALIIAMWR